MLHVLLLTAWMVPQDKAAERVRDLGANDFRTREQAEKDLLELARSDFEGVKKALLAALKDSDPERILAARRILPLIHLLQIEGTRAKNERRYAEVKERLWKEDRGRWTVLADGELLGPFESSAKALEAADRRAPWDAHRFVWRPAVDDVPVDFSFSPRFADKNWMFQVGLGFSSRVGVNAWSVTFGTIQWNTARGSVKWPDMTVTLPLEAADGKNKKTVSFAWSQEFTGDLAVDEPTARELGLERSAIPGLARPDGDEKHGRRRSWVRASIPDLKFEELVPAILIPR